MSHPFQATRFFNNLCNQISLCFIVRPLAALSSLEHTPILKEVFESLVAALGNKVFARGPLLPEVVAVACFEEFPAMAKLGANSYILSAVPHCLLASVVTFGLL